MTQPLRYDFLNNPTLVPGTESPSTTPDLSITRATKATMTDADGYIREVQAGEARMTGATLNHNLIDYGNSFDTSWTKNNCTVTSGQTDPDGGLTAWSLNSDATASAVHRLENAQAVSKSGTYRFSCYAKASGLDWIYLSSQNFGTPPGNIIQYYDVANGVTGAADADADAIGIVDVGGGWYRCWFEVTLSDADISGTFYISPAPSDGTATYNGNSAEDTVIWRSQVEKVTSSGAPGTYVDTAANPASSLSGTSTKGLLVEEARTNVHIESETPDLWSSVTRVTVSTNSTTAPDGSTTADTLVEDGTAANNHFVGQSIGSKATSTPYTHSVFVKAANRTWVQLRTDRSGDNVTQSFDVGTGALGTGSAGVNDAGIEDYGGGWYRCWYSFTNDAAAGTSYVLIGEGDQDVTFDGLSQDSLYIWGAMFEAGSTVSSYIATTTASVTRNADVVGNTSLGGVIGTGPLTTYVQLDQPYTGAGNEYVLFFDDGTSLDRYQHVIDSGKDSNMLHNVSVGNGVAITPTMTLGTDARVAFGWAIDDAAQYVDGAAQGTDVDCGVLSDTPTRLYLGSLAGAAPFNGHIAEIRYYDSRIDNTGLENLSNGLFPIPDVVDLTSAGATTLLEANGFVADTTTTAYSDSVAVGNVIEQTAAAGTYAANGTTVTLTISLGADPNAGNPGGWLNEYNAYKQRAKAQAQRRQEVLQKVRELDGIDGEIAELMQLDEAKADEDKRIAEFRALLDKEISKAELDKAGLLNARINRAYDRAMKKATFSAIEALEREIEDAIEEEDFLFIIMSIQ